MSLNTSRRTLLAGVSALVGGSAGCLGRTFLSEPVPSDKYERTVSVTHVDSVPNAYGAEFGIEVAQSKITAEQSAVLQSRITSTREEERQFSMPYYKGASSQDGNTGIVLYSKDAADNPANRPGDQLNNYAPPCVGTDGKSRSKLVWSQEAQPIPTLAPNESRTDELLVVDDPTHRGCLPVGTYRFESRFEPSWMDERFDWGFSLDVND